MKRQRIRTIALILGILGLTVSLFGCVKGSLTHKATVGQHTLREAVGAFQDAEIAEFNKGFVPQDVHVKIQTVIQKVALAGIDLDNSVAAGTTAAGVKAKFDNVYALLDQLNTDGLLFVKNQNSKQTLEVALDAIRAIVDNILLGVS